MKAAETRLEDFLSSNKTQFVIPVYQRNYNWTKDQCKQLLDDILEAGSNRNISAHFIGSIVHLHDDVYTSSRIKELTIIDGQQRLTTITLIYVCLFRLAKASGDIALEHEINETYLINKFAPEEEKLKLRPTENNDEAFKVVLRGDEYSGYSNLIDNFNYFKNRILEENYRFVLDGLGKLIIVEIALDRKYDDPQRIFESLNSTGLELSQADLIRNYILMGLKPRDQNRIYKNYWEVIEKLAKDEITNESRVSEYIRDYLTIENRRIPVKKNVYIEYKAKFPTTTLDGLEYNLKELKRFAIQYNKLLNPKNEPDTEIRKQLQYINRLEINVAYPFLMKVYDDYDRNFIDKPTFLEILNLVQSFTWRRFIVGLPTNALNKIFMMLYEKAEPQNYLDSIKRWLVSRPGSQRFPKDKEVIEALKVKDVYNIKSKNRAYLLEKLENYQNREPVNIEGNIDITIEHILPQNPETKWKVDLGTEEYVLIYENYLNTISNLTLSGNNGKLGNKAFAFKRDLENAGYKDSRLWLNKYLSSIERWGINELEERFNQLSKRFLSVWAYPAVQIEDKIDGEEVNIFEAEDPKHKKLDYAVFFDEKIDVQHVSKLYLEVMSKLFDLHPETFFTTDLGERISLTKNPNEAGIRQMLQLNDSYFIEGNLDSNNKFEKIKYALSLFDLEDELSIKYV